MRFLDWRKQILEEIRADLSSSNSPAGCSRLLEVEKEYDLIKEIQHG